MDDGLDREIKRLEAEISNYVYGVLVKDKDSGFRQELLNSVRKAVAEEISRQIRDLRDEIRSPKSKSDRPISSSDGRYESLASEVRQLRQMVEGIPYQLAAILNNGELPEAPPPPAPIQSDRPQEKPQPHQRSGEQQTQHTQLDDGGEERKPSAFGLWVNRNQKAIKLGSWIALALLVIGGGTALGVRIYKNYFVDETSAAIRNNYDPSSDNPQPAPSGVQSTNPGGASDPSILTPTVEVSQGFERLMNLKAKLDGKPVTLEPQVTKLCKEKHITVCNWPQYPKNDEAVYATAVIQFAAVAIAEKANCTFPIKQIDGQLGVASKKGLKSLQTCLIEHHYAGCIDEVTCGFDGDLNTALERKDGYISVLGWLLPMVPVSRQ